MKQMILYVIIPLLTLGVLIGATQKDIPMEAREPFSISQTLGKEIVSVMRDARHVYLHEVENQYLYYQKRRLPTREFSRLEQDTVRRALLDNGHYRLDVNRRVPFVPDSAIVFTHGELEVTVFVSHGARQVVFDLGGRSLRLDVFGEELMTLLPLIPLSEKPSA